MMMNDAEKNIVQQDPMIPFPIKVQKLIWETEDVFTLYLSPNGESGNEFHFAPGQFNMLYAFGMGEAAISISSNPFKPNTLIHTIHRVGTVTSALSKLRKGDFIGLRGPFGSKWPVDEAIGKDVCIMAGGIGLPPLRPVIHTIQKNKKDFGKVFILYGARSPRDLLYRVELEKWGKLYDVEVLVTVDHSDSSWKGHIGVVTGLLNYVNLDNKNTIAMICGPEVMMRFSIEELLDKGFPESNIYLSLERNMKCAVGFCGHCQLGPKFVCKDGPVFNYTQIKHFFEKKEI